MAAGLAARRELKIIHSEIVAERDDLARVRTTAAISMSRRMAPLFAPVIENDGNF
jgi:hypothetical protein